MEVPLSVDDLQTYNDNMYEEINLELYEDMHSVSTKVEAEFDEYVDMSFRGQVGNSPRTSRPFSSIYATPQPLKNTKYLLLLDSIQVVTQLGDGVFGEV